MTEDASGAQDLGQLLESARTNVLRITGREAARRAGISASRWRQVAQGARASDRVVVAMALAVDVDPAKALAAAGLPVRPEHIAELVADVRRSAAAREPEGDDQMAAEIERISSLPISADARRRMIKALVDVYEQHAAEQRRTA